MASFLDPIQQLMMDVEEEAQEVAEEAAEETASNTTDLGLESISSIDLLGFGMCLFLSVFAFKVKSFPFAVVAAIGWLIVGFTVSAASGSPVIFLLTFAIAAIQIVYGSNYKGW